MNVGITLIEVSDLVKYYPLTKGVFRRVVGWVKAVDGISFTIPPGLTYALVGESGCGKTTTVKVLLQLEEATSGHIFWKGQNLFKLKADGRKNYREDVQAVFQDPMSSLNPRMRVKDIISEPLIANKRCSKGEAFSRAIELIVDVGLQREDANKYPHEFSGGQRQRIAVARAIALNPKLIVLDEPVSSLDMSIRAQIMNLLKKLQEQYGISYLLIAHDIGTVRYMSKYMAVMYLGKIVEKGLSSQVCSRPYHPYTQGLIISACPVRPGEKFGAPLPGEIPSPINPPSGCGFHTRCPFAIDCCSNTPPPWMELQPDHFVACHYYKEHGSIAADEIQEHLNVSLRGVITI